MRELTNIEEFVGKTLVNVNVLDSLDGDKLVFTFDDGSEYEMYHTQDCCESVYLDEVDGEFSELYGDKILRAYESSDSGEGDSYGGSSTWTFYQIATVNSSVHMKWFGESNGYYSESVYLYRVA